MKRFLYGLAILLLVNLSPLVSVGSTYTWSALALSSNWNAGSNWTNDGGLLNILTVPKAGDDVVISGTLLTFYPVVGAGGGACKNITISGAGATLTVNGTLAVGGNALISASGVAVAVASGGTLNISGNTSLTSSGIKLTITGTATTGAISFGSATGNILSVNGTLTSSGIISQNLPSTAGNVSTQITGMGSISCSAINFGTDDTTPTANGTNTTTIKSNVTQLTVWGLITVNSASAASKLNNAVFDVANDNGSCTIIAGGIIASNFNPVTGGTSSFLLDNISAGATKLKLTGTIPVTIGTNGKVDFYATGSGSSTVEYAGASAQAVAASGTSTGLDATPAIYQNLSFSGAGVKKLASGSLSLTGDWNSAGGSVDGLSNSSTVIFKGTTEALYDAGTLNGGVIFNNLTIQGGSTKTISGSSATANGFSVAGTGILTIDGAVANILTVGSLGKLTLISDNTGTATVAAIPSNCTITGNVNVQRYIKAGTVAQNARNYRLLSSPVNMNPTGVTDDSAAAAYTTLSYLSNNPGLFTGGPGGSNSGFSAANATPTIYLYNESLAPINIGFNTGNFKGLTNIKTNPVNVYDATGTDPNSTATIYAGNGYMLYYTGDNVNGLYNKQNRVGGVYADPDAATVAAVGTLNQGNVPVKLWWNNSTTLSAAKTGYNLVGNPYAATIDWDGVTSGKIAAANVDTKIYVFNYSNKNYGTYQPNLGSSTGSNNASRYIASGQGFFVVANAGATLTFTESAKTTTQPTSSGASYLLMGMPAQVEQKPQVLRIKLVKDSINTDESLIAFEPDAKNDYEPILDADRLNGIGNVATLASYATQNTQMLAINHVHSIDSTTRVKLYVNVTGAQGINALTFSGLETLDQRYDVFLIDHYKKDSLQINLYKQYAFNIRPDSAGSYGDSRFELAFHKKSTINYRLLSFTGAPVSNTIALKWKVEAEQNATGFTVEKGDGNGSFTPVYNLQSSGDGTYTWVDKIPATGANTYRLKQDDVFSNISYSNVLSINFNSPTISNQSLMAYPNPVTTSLNVKINTPISGQVLLKVISSAGQTLLSKVSSGNTIQQNVNNFLPGTYIVEVSDNATKKVIGRVKISKQ